MQRARAFVAFPTVLVLVAVAACNGEKKNDTLAQDTTLNRDMQLANADTAAKPALKDVPAATTPTPSAATTKPRTTTPSRSTPSKSSNTPTKSTTASGNTVTRTPGAAEKPLGTIAAGTSIALTSNSRICTNTNHVGETVTATVANSVTGSNGAVIPAGAKASLEITELKRSENINDKIQMSFRVKSISFGGHTYPVTASVSSAQVDRVKNQPGSKDVQKVGTGAAVGAVVGQILGHSTKSTIIGGAVGAAAGAGAAATTANYEGCVPTGGNITIALQDPVQVHTS